MIALPKFVAVPVTFLRDVTFALLKSASAQAHRTNNRRDQSCLTATETAIVSDAQGRKTLRIWMTVTIPSKVPRNLEETMKVPSQVPLMLLFSLALLQP